MIVKLAGGASAIMAFDSLKGERAEQALLLHNRQEQKQ